MSDDLDDDKDCPECGYYCLAMREGGPCQTNGTRGNEFEYDCDFAEPGGRSALRRETIDNPRNLPCPDCGNEDRLTPKDVALGYCCDQCADRNESGFDY